MSDTQAALLSTEHEGNDSWSDIDESLLAQCDHTEETTRDENTEARDKKSATVSTCSPSQLCQCLCTTGCNEETGATDKTMHTGCSEGHMERMAVIQSHVPGGLTPLCLSGKMDYLCVTDLSQQLWCEQHLHYTLLGVNVPVLPEETAVPPLPLPAAHRPEVKAGQSLHLARELELHDVVQVKLSSPADKWALHVLNLLQVVRQFLAGVRVAREIPIFGDPFGTGDFLFGFIDELRFDPDQYSLGLVELKTRQSKSMPGKAQKKQHVFQVHLYKRLWDNLVMGHFSADLFLAKLRLAASANQPLSEELLKHLDASGVSASSLAELLAQLTASVQALVCVGAMELEYVLQETGAVIGRCGVVEDADWLRRTFTGCMDYWHGRRREEGVEVEEAWKCGRCEFSPLCQWRIHKSNVLSAANQQHQQSAGVRTGLCQ